MGRLTPADRPGDGGEALVVGAGPVGLLLGCELRQHGIAVRLVDAGRGHTLHSRANVIWPRNLELLGRIGVLDEFLARGHRLAGTAFYSNGRRIGEARLSRMDDTPRPYGLMIAQRETEEILERRFAELGGTVERGVRLTALDDSGDRPAAKLEHADGRVEETEPGWLIGADGAHSTVRKALGIGYEGESVDVSFAIADARLTTDLAPDLSHYCYSSRGAVVMGPMGEGVFRLAVNVPHDAYPDPDAPPPLDHFRQVVAERGAGRTTVDALLWSATFRVRCRLAASFRRGRCFLVGDAAHIVSPAGGQGMNTGMQDAFNLAWKLSGVIRGELAEPLLDTYDAERRAVSHHVARSTAFMTRFGVATTPGRTAVRDTAFRLADRTGLLQRHMAPQLSQTDIGYGEAGAGGRTARRGPLPPGARLPVLVAGADRPGHEDGWPAVARDRHTVLLWPGRGTPPAAWPGFRDQVRSALPDDTPVLELDAWTPGALARALGPRPAALVVRPDGHLHSRVGVPRAGDVLAALRRARGGE